MNGTVVTNVLAMYAILVGVNLPAPLLGLRFENSATEERLWFEPPGALIPVVWFALFTLLGYARSVAVRVSAIELSWLIVALAVLCATYAYYTLGLAHVTGISALWFGLWGNLAVISVSLFVVHRAWTEAPTGAIAVLPVAVWTSFATAIVLGRMRVQGLL